MLAILINHSGLHDISYISYTGISTLYMQRKFPLTSSSISFWLETKLVLFMTWKVHFRTRSETLKEHNKKASIPHQEVVLVPKQKQYKKTPRTNHNPIGLSCFKTQYTCKNKMLAEFKSLTTFEFIILQTKLLCFRYLCLWSDFHPLPYDTKNN